MSTAGDEFTAQLVARVLEGVAPDTGTEPAAIGAQAETWAEFRERATDEMEMLVDEIWPAGAMGFIASRPKAGKTWLGLALALAVSTGCPYLGRFTVPEARPVVYLALEGTRAGLRARIGSMARGMGIDPDGDELARLRMVYKPAGLDLGDPAWGRWITETATELGAGLVVVDVLRRAANVRENNEGAQDFARLLRNLGGLEQDGCALAFLHHFTKATPDSGGRVAGERMTGSGALHGAYDVGLFITSATPGARLMSVEPDARDIAPADPFSVSMTGEGTGTSGGFTYRDTLHLSWGEPVSEADKLADDLRALLLMAPGMTKQDAAAALDVGRSSKAFTKAWQAVNDEAEGVRAPGETGAHARAQGGA